MGIFRSLSGTILLELTSADIPSALAAITEQNIRIFDIRTKGDLTVRMEVRREDYKQIQNTCRKRGEALHLVSRGGFYWTGKRLLGRPLLILAAVWMVAAAIYLPGRVFFIRVEGNERIPANQILEAAGEAGIRFGASRREVRSERMKNALLQKLPGLQWAGVNTSGCVAIISVRERTEPETGSPQEPEVSSIVAVCDGVILSATVIRGSSLCQPGQAVTQGQVLISGYTDLGRTIRAERAEGEIFAMTRRVLRTVTPSDWLYKGDSSETRVRYCLIVGKNRINLWKDSGISDGSCDRMYEEYYVTLPGGFQLPLAIAKETVVCRDTALYPLMVPQAEELLTRFTARYLPTRMVSGRILSREETVTEADGVYLLEGVYLCTEMIGRQRQEKIGE